MMKLLRHLLRIRELEKVRKPPKGYSTPYLDPRHEHIDTDMIMMSNLAQTSGDASRVLDQHRGMNAAEIAKRYGKQKKVNRVARAWRRFANLWRIN